MDNKFYSHLEERTEAAKHSKKQIEFIPGKISPDDMHWYTSINPGMTATADVLRIGDDFGSCDYVIFTGKHTPYDFVRDCGDHWIHAGYSSFDRIDKGTYKVTKDYGDR